MILYMGLGRMGLPMAGHALRSGQEAVGCDPDEGRRRLFEALGGEAVADPTPALARASAVVVMVGSEDQVRDIASQAARSCRPGTLLIVASTVLPDTVADLGRQAEEIGLGVVDAPVCRAEIGAVAGTLLALLAGAEDACRKASKIMEPYCSDIAVVGERLGAAQVAKTVNNMILWACALANDEGMRLAESWSLDTKALRGALVTSSADNWCLRNWDRLDEMRWSIKDMEIATKIAGKAGVEIPLGNCVERLVREVPVLSHA
jgi:3-hydroxyisobutyrate dehydrogenase